MCAENAIYSRKMCVKRIIRSPCSRRKGTIDKCNRALFKLNMGSKRSAVTLISYIYKNVKRKRKVEFGRN